MGLLSMAGIRCYSPAAVHAAANGRSRNDHDALSVRTGALPDAVHTQLAVSIFCRELYRPDPLARRHDPDDSLLRLFLDLLYQVRYSLFSPSRLLCTYSHAYKDTILFANRTFALGCCKGRSSTFPCKCIPVEQGGAGERRAGFEQNRVWGGFIPRILANQNVPILLLLSSLGKKTS